MRNGCRVKGEAGATSVGLPCALEVQEGVRENPERSNLSHGLEGLALSESPRKDVTSPASSLEAVLGLAVFR